MKNYRINLIRHGLTQANVEGRYVGHTDYELCTEGISELVNMSHEYVYPNVERVYSSPMLRCIQTAEILYPEHKLFVVDDLKEMNFGDFEGFTHEELCRREDFNSWMDNSYENAPPNGESGVDFSARLVQALRGIFREMMEEKIFETAIIAHGGVIMSLLFTMGMPKAPFGHYYAGNGQGYSLVLTPQMWMRDNAFEICGTIPMPKDYTGDEGWVENPYDPSPYEETGDER